MLKIHRVPAKLLTIINDIIQKWNLVLTIPVKDGEAESDPIQVRNGILQGDSLYPSLYTLSKNVISWLIRSSEGYKMSQPLLKR